MKKFVVVSRTETEVMEYTSMGNFPEAATKWVVKDSDTGKEWSTTVMHRNGLGGERFCTTDGGGTLVLMPIYENTKPPFSEVQCFVTMPDYKAISLFCWGGYPIPEGFDLLDYDKNPGSDVFGVLLQNRKTGIKVIGQAGALKSCPQK